MEENRFGFLARSASPILILVVLFVLGSCDKQDNLVGPCVHNLLSPILEIESATTVGTNEPIENLRILSISIDGRSTELEELLQPQSFGASIEEGYLACEVPCGFGIERGHYSLVISGDGLLSLTMEVDVQYAQNWGTCPSFSEGATAIAIHISED